MEAPSAFTLCPLPGCFTQADIAVDLAALPERQWVAGRVPMGTQLQLPADSRLSSQHFAVAATDAGLAVIDKSTNGTFLNGRRLAKGRPEPVAHGDIITLVVPSASAAARDPTLRGAFVGFVLQCAVPDATPKLGERRSAGFEFDTQIRRS